MGLRDATLRLALCPPSESIGSECSEGLIHVSCPEQHPTRTSLDISVERIIDWIDRLLYNQAVLACTIGALLASNLISLFAWAAIDSASRFIAVFGGVVMGAGLVVFLALSVGLRRRAADARRLDHRSWSEGELKDLNRLLGRIETASRVLGATIPAGIIGSPWLRLWLFSLFDEFSTVSILVTVAVLILLVAISIYCYGSPTPKDLQMEIQGLLRHHHGLPVILADR